MKIVAISDTHGSHDRIDIPDTGDVLVHCGDFTKFGKGFDEFITWYEKAPQPNKILLLGNHEWSYLKSQRLAEINPHKISLLRDEGFPPKTTATIDGVTFSLPGEDTSADVVLAHAPPDNLSPAGNIGVRVGLDIQNPKLFICGHAHDERGIYKNTDHTKYINCSVFNGEEPIVEIITENSAKRKRKLKN